ncbi:ACP S-malonyltransferase [bacterium]|nr:ACP S-malonyltransferase [bacterium]
MTAYLFPGQGSQYVGMGKEVLRYKEAEEVFAEASDTLGYDLQKLCLEGPLDKLSLTEYSQAAILTVSIAYLRSLPHIADYLPSYCAGHSLGEYSALVACSSLSFAQALQADYLPSYCAGHSLGEYSALVACSSLSFAQALQVVQKRANLMKEAASKNPGGMSAILKLTIDEVSEIAKDSACEIANINSRTQIVISGRLEALSLAEALTKEKGGKAIRLATSGGFHSSLMKEVELGLAEVLSGIEIEPPKFKFIPNILAEPVDNPEEIRDCLIKQVTGRVRWQETMSFLEKKGVERVIEVGPGSVLANLAKKMGLAAISFEGMIK